MEPEDVFLTVFLAAIVACCVGLMVWAFQIDEKNDKRSQDTFLSSCAKVGGKVSDDTVCIKDGEVVFQLKDFR